MTDTAAALGSPGQHFTGDVIGPADPAYDECRKVFNAMHDKRPAMIARCTTTADVVAAVNVARRNGLLAAVRCGGHSVAGLSVRDGILIDLAGLNKIAVGGFTTGGGGNFGIVTEFGYRLHPLGPAGLALRPLIEHTT